MIPKQIRLKNFLSYRSGPDGEGTTLCFDDAKLWMLSGRNGAGKSTVFDAIKFALYGKHRDGDGEQHAERLINCHEDALLVEFDFAVGSQMYRVKRTIERPRKAKESAKQTRQASEWIGPKKEDWRPCEGTTSDTGFEDWVRKALGMSFKTFTAAVLLQQGKSDLLLTATAKERHEMLSEVIDLSAYKRLAGLADERRKTKKAVADNLQQKWGSVGPWSEAEITRLILTLQETEKTISAAKTRHDTLIGGIIHARRWESLNTEQKRLQGETTAAQTLLDQAEEIKENAARWDALTRALPLLKDLMAAQSRLLASQKALAEFDHQEQAWRDKHAPRFGLNAATAPLPDLIAAVQATVGPLEEWDKSLPWLKTFAEARRNRQQEEKKWDAAEQDVIAQRKWISALAVQITAARREADAAGTFAQTAAVRLGAANKGLEEAEKRWKRFQSVETLENCSYCGQPLTEDHRQIEHDRLRKALQEAQKAQEKAQQDNATADQNLTTANNTLEDLKRKNTLSEKDENDAALRAKLAQQAMITAERQAQTALDNLPAAQTVKIRPSGGVTLADFLDSAYPTTDDLKELKDQIDTLPALKSDWQKMTPLPAQRGAEDRLKTQAADDVQRGMDTLLDAAWKKEAETLTTKRLEALEQEQQTLQGADEKLTGLENAEREQAARQRRQQEIADEIQDIPEDARRPECELEWEKTQTEKELADAEHAQKTDAAAKAEQEGRRDEQSRLVGERDKAKREADLYKMLTELLGRDDLQRHLLRRAETAIVSDANQTLNRLSGGTLRMEERAAAEGAEALDVDVHDDEKGGGPFGLAFLSGSQKFRVAVSLALGIGRYASQEGQRIQSVIIDEGFGSLDKEGQDDMVQELHNLSSVLEKVIIVSHQEQFRDGFEDRYDISVSPVDNGSCAARFPA